MEYPVFNIDVGPCDEFFLPLLFFSNPIFYDKQDLNFYNTFLHHKNYVDRNGDVYKAICAKEVSSWLRKKLPLRRKYQIIFEPTGKKMTFEEVKLKLFECITGYQSEEAKEVEIESINQYKSLKELL